MFVCAKPPVAIVQENPAGGYLAALGKRNIAQSPLEKLFDRIFIEQWIERPQGLTDLGLFESLGLKQHNRFLDDYSKPKMDKLRALAQSHWNQLQAFPKDGLSEDDLLSLQLVTKTLQEEIEGDKFLFHEYPVNQLFGVTQNLSALFLNLQPLSDAEDAQNYVARLGEIGRQFDQVIERMEEQKKRGIFPPRFAIAKGLDSIEKWLDTPVEKNPFYTRLVGQADKILAEAKQTMEQKVYPAYQKLQKYLKKRLPELTREDGVWALPNGDAYYAYLLKRHTTLDTSAEEIHAIGVKEVARIQKEIEALFKKEGLWTEGRSVAAHLQALAENPAYFYPNTEEGRKECLAKFEEILERSRKVLGPYFPRKPQAGVTIQPVPSYEEIGAPGAYYMGPSSDGTRQGAFFVNLGGHDPLPKYRMETLTIHEAEPGHHFERSLSAESAAHILRKQVQNTAYIEGWALYVEKFAYEQGFYSSALDQIGHLQDELFRAARLVVDTGIHWKRWSREEAIAYFSQAMGVHPSKVVTEIERYFVLPGQACAYKMGQLRFLEVREQAKKRLGDQFDLKQFHSDMLKRGVIPLSML